MKNAEKMRQDLEIALKSAFEKNDVGHLEQTAIFCELFVSKVASMVSSKEDRRKMVEGLTAHILDMIEARDKEDDNKTDEVATEAKSE